MKSNDKRIEALKKAAKHKKTITLNKVNDAINYMLKNGLAINFNSVAEVAGISKTWLYQNPKIKLKIEKYRKGTNCISYETLNNRNTKFITENKKLKMKNNLLQNQIQSLKQQLETIYGELYKIKKSKKHTK